MSCKRSEFLQQERGTWIALGVERTARILPEERLSKKCDEAADLHRQCTELESEAREDRERVTPLEKKIDNLREAHVCES